MVCLKVFADKLSIKLLYMILLSSKLHNTNEVISNGKKNNLGIK